MQVFTSLESFSTSQPQIVTIGVFDGVHRGHQHLIAHAAAVAARRGAQVTAIAFWPPPIAVLRPDQPLRALTLRDEKIAALADLGLIDHLIVLPFTPELAALSADAFLHALRARMPLVALVEGDDFTLGHDRQGTIAWLTARGETLGFSVEVVSKREIGGAPVSSTRIRQLVAAGDVDDALLMLGRPYHLAGVVVRGDARGKSLGFPTANLAIDPAKLLPGNGVYAVRARLDGTSSALWAGVASMGVRPVFQGTDRRFEVHLLDVSSDLYGVTLHVAMIGWLREERQFESVEALIAQMSRDVRDARARLAADTEGAAV
jgi:riboflavin kinase/FMN adenylyltransferase